MRYLAVFSCFLLVLCAGCADNRDGPNLDSVTAVEGQDIVLDIGVARIEISADNIGTDPGQIPPGARVSMDVPEKRLSGSNSFSPVVRVRVREDGDDVTGLDFNPPALFEMSYDFTLAESLELAPADLALARVVGSNVTELSFAQATPAPDTEFTIPVASRVRAQFTGVGRFAVIEATTPGTLPDLVALTGTVSTVFTAALFQLADAQSAYSVNLVIPQSDTASPPTVIALSPGSFSGNPTDPNNRVLTVQFDGTIYTSAQTGASVTVNLQTFTGTGSTGTMVGTVVEQGGSATLPINFTFNTGASAGVALAGTVTDALGRRTMTLTAAAGDETVLVIMPDSLPNAGLDPISFDDSTFDTGDPLDPDGRVVFVTEDGETFSSAAPVVGDVTVTFQTWNEANLTGTGTITGTVASATPNIRAVSYTFTVTAGAGAGAGDLEPGTPFDVVTGETADATAVIHDGVSYIGVWLSDIGTTTRTIEMVDIDDVSYALGTQRNVEPTAALVPEGGFGAAGTIFGELCIVGATGDDPNASSVIAVFFDYDGDTLLDEVNLGTGTAPRVVYHAAEDLFVIVWQDGDGVSAATFEFDGTQVGTTQTVFSTGTLAGMAAADPDDQVLITESSGSGVRGRYLAPSTGAVASAAFDITTTQGGGLCVWDPDAEQYLVMIQGLIFGVFTVQQVVALEPGDTETTGDPLTLFALEAMTQAAGGADGVLFADAAGNLFAVRSGTNGPEAIDVPAFSAITGLDLDVTPDGAPVASDGNGGFLMLAARGADGVTGIPITITP